MNDKWCVFRLSLHFFPLPNTLDNRFSPPGQNSFNACILKPQDRLTPSDEGCLARCSDRFLEVRLSFLLLPLSFLSPSFLSAGVATPDKLLTLPSFRRPSTSSRQSTSSEYSASGKPTPLVSSRVDSASPLPFLSFFPYAPPSHRTASKCRNLSSPSPSWLACRSPAHLSSRKERSGDGKSNKQ
jgi:hypothetical protein